MIEGEKSDFWIKEGKKRSLTLFHEVAKRVPAYKNFLKKNKINPDKIKTWEDFKFVPPTSKKNYLKQYPLEKLCWDGSLKKPLVFASTSGSTGEPFYFPRNEQLSRDASISHELFFKNNNKNNKSTLVIVGFGMGVWIGGLITYKAFEIVNQNNNYPISIITPGVNKVEIIKAIEKVSPYFDQTILAGYPPFIKDIIDELDNEHFNLKKLNLKLIFAAEAFTENFREYLVKKTGIKNIFLNTMNIYGTVDMGAMAFETPLAILIRRLAIKNKNLFNDIFGQIQKTPTLAQYNPFSINFEVLNGEILLTGDSAMPLVRYAIGDNGGVLTFNEIKKKFKKHNIDLKKEAVKVGIKDKIYELPFVYVYERNDFSTTIYGLQIYPEFIKEPLIGKKLNKFITGKFAMITKYDKKQNQFLEINIELKKNKKNSKKLHNLVLKKIIDNLQIKSSEFKELSSYIKDKPLLKLIFWPAEHPRYFKSGVKQKWVL